MVLTPQSFSFRCSKLVDCLLTAINRSLSRVLVSVFIIGITRTLSWGEPLSPCGGRGGGKAPSDLMSIPKGGKSSLLRGGTRMTLIAGRR